MRFLFVVLMLFSSQVYADCSNQTPFGYPQPSVKVGILCRIAYVTEYFDTCKTPLVTVEHLTPASIGGTEPRQNFHEDTDLPPAIRVTLKDYDGRGEAGFDIGHVAPAADFREGSDVMSQSFLLSNTVPQAAKNNRGIWRTIEIKTRSLALTQGEIFVFTGMIYNDLNHRFNGMCIPDYMYKVVINPNTLRGIGFIVPNNNSVVGGKLSDYERPIGEIEAMAHVNFTPKLNSARAQQLKQSIAEEFK